MRLISIAVLLLFCAGAAFAQGGPCYVHTGPWTRVWDFANGLQGWQLRNGAWVPSYPVGGKNGTIWAGDQAYVEYDTDNDPLLKNKLSGAGGKFFVIQCDVYMNASNMLQGNGLSVRRQVDGKGPWAIGTQASNYGIAGNDKSWYNTLRARNWGLNYPHWVTLQIDYGYSKPGYFTVGYTVCPGNPANWTPGSWAWAIDYSHANDPNNPSEVHPTDIFRYLQIGGSVVGSPWTGWAQAYYGAVRIFVPEPGSMLALGTGLVGLFGLIRRRK